MKKKKKKIKKKNIFKVIYTGGYCQVLDKRIEKFAKKIGYKWYASGVNYCDEGERDISFFRK